jgi:hypothetical protein
LFPNPRTRKAFEWLIVKADEAVDHAVAWEGDKKKIRVLRQMYLELSSIEDLELDTILDEYISTQEGSEAD